MLGFEITSIDNNWIYVHHDYRDALDGFIMLLKSIEGELDGRILQMDGDDIQYTIQKDPYNLIYRWDAQCGIVVIVNNINDMQAVVNMLEYHFDKLNN